MLRSEFNLIQSMFHTLGNYWSLSQIICKRKEYEIYLIPLSIKKLCIVPQERLQTLGSEE